MSAKKRIAPNQAPIDECHPLFPAEGDDDTPPEVGWISVGRYENGKLAFAPELFSAQDMRSDEDIHRRFGGGTYKIQARSLDKSRITAVRSRSLAGHPLSMIPSDPSTPPATAAPPVATGPTDPNLVMMQMFMTMMQSQTQVQMQMAQQQAEAQARASERQQETTQNFMALLMQQQRDSTAMMIASQDRQQQAAASAAATMMGTIGPVLQERAKGSGSMIAAIEKGIALGRESSSPSAAVADDSGKLLEGLGSMLGAVASMKEASTREKEIEVKAAETRHATLPPPSPPHAHAIPPSPPPAAPAPATLAQAVKNGGAS